MKALRTAIAFAGTIAASTAAFGQSFTGTIASGYIYGNSSASAAKPQGVSASSLFDRAFGASSGTVIVRSGSWGASSTPTLGVAGSSVGSIAFANATSGTVTIQPATGALGAAVATLPAGTYNIVGDSLSQTLTNKIFNCANNTCTVRIASDVSGLGTGVATALGVNTGSAGAFVVNGGALGTPSSGTLTNATGLPVGTGISGLGTSVATALGTATGSVNGFPRIIATGTIALGTSAIASGACGTAATASASNILTTDIIDIGFSGDPTATTGYTPSAMLSIVTYPTANTVNVKQCNLTGGSITPSALTLNWAVRR